MPGSCMADARHNKKDASEPLFIGLYAVSVSIVFEFLMLPRNSNIASDASARSNFLNIGKPRHADIVRMMFTRIG